MTVDADIRGAGVPMIHVHVDGEGMTQEAADAILRVLEPQEPRLKTGAFWCPACGRRVFNSDCDAFCGHCGQRIDWGQRYDK